MVQIESTLKAALIVAANLERFLSGQKRGSSELHSFHLSLFLFFLVFLCIALVFILIYFQRVTTLKPEKPKGREPHVLPLIATLHYHHV